MRRLLLRTSVLEQVNGALADVLVGAPAGAHPARAGGGERVRRRARRRAGLVPLPPPLRGPAALELRRTEPDAVALHRPRRVVRAHGEVTEAVRHAQVAEDWAQVARLLVDGALTLSLTGQHAT